MVNTGGYATLLKGGGCYGIHNQDFNSDYCVSVDIYYKSKITAPLAKVLAVI